MNSPSLKSFVEAEREYSLWNVKSASIVRRPLPNAIEKFLRFFGSSKVAKHDTLFHLFLDTTLEDPLTGERIVLRTERNETLGVKRLMESEAAATVWGEGRVEIDLSGRPDLNYGDMIANARDRHATISDLPFTKYSLGENNCQMFVRNVLEANGLWNEAEHSEFTDQKAEELVSQWQNTALSAIIGSAEKYSNWKSGSSSSQALQRPTRNPRLRFHLKHHSEPQSAITYTPHEIPASVLPTYFSNVTSGVIAAARY